MNESIEDFHIYASNLLKTSQTRILKDNDLVGTFNVAGDIERYGSRINGLYLDDMRHLSRLDLRLLGQRPILLSSTVKTSNLWMTADLTNAEATVGERRIPDNTFHLHRRKFLFEKSYYETLTLQNFRTTALPAVELVIRFGADFRDIFEIRGLERSRRGECDEPAVRQREVEFGYRGLDDTLRVTRLEFDRPPDSLDAGQARFELDVPSDQPVELSYAVHCWNRPADETRPDGAGRSEESRPPRLALAEASRRLQQRRENQEEGQCTITSSNGFFDAWIARSRADLQMLSTDTDWGPYPHAGTPWFNAVFGRDGILTAYEVLTTHPQMARGVLGYLAANQAREVDPARDAAPGKILHEARHSETAATGEVPFGRYYGSVDATPLFVWLAGEYLERTRDLELIKEIWPAIKRAIEWLDSYGDPDDDGFIEYARKSDKGLIQQGWKDSHDSVFHADGRPADGPIALCEVQAYTYGARLAAAAIARALGENDYAHAQECRAGELAEAFEEAFWLEDKQIYALALDGNKAPCRVRSSNAGHCLLFDIVPRERAAQLAETLASDDLFNGWGVQTIADSETRYNPLSYHNGSVWPHDSALVARGLARYGYTREARQIFEGLFIASQHFDLHRLPELFCGFPRRPGEGPTLYPVACSPQAWAAGAAFLLLDSLLNISIDAARQRIDFQAPRLPESIDTITIRRLPVGDGSVSLTVRRYRDDVGIEILKRDGPIEVRVLK